MVLNEASNIYKTILSTSADCKNFFDLVLNFLIVQNRFCKVPPQLCDGSTIIHDIFSPSTGSSSVSRLAITVVNTRVHNVSHT